MFLVNEILRHFLEESEQFLRENKLEWEQNAPAEFFELTILGDWRELTREISVNFHLGKVLASLMGLLIYD